MPVTVSPAAGLDSCVVSGGGVNPMFQVNGGKLTLSGVTLDGGGGTVAAVAYGGSLTVGEGTVLKSAGGTGVELSGGRLNLNGGQITGCGTGVKVTGEGKPYLSGGPRVMGNSSRNVDLSGASLPAAVNVAGPLTGAEVGLYIADASYNIFGKTFGSAADGAADAVSDASGKPLTGWPAVYGQAGNIVWGTTVPAKVMLLRAGAEVEVPESAGAFILTQGGEVLAAGLGSAYALVNPAAKAVDEDSANNHYLRAMLDGTEVHALGYDSDGWYYTTESGGARHRFPAEKPLRLIYYVNPLPLAVKLVELGSDGSLTVPAGEDTVVSLTDAAWADSAGFIKARFGDEAVAPPAIHDNLYFWYVVLGNGGAVYAVNGSVTVSGTAGNPAAFQNNSATENGGAVCALGGEVTVTGHASLHDNSAAGKGGAVYSDAGGVTVSGGTVTGNSAAGGGAVYAAADSVTFSGGTVTGNTVTGDSAAVETGDGVKLYFSGDVNITGNRRDGDDGAEHNVLLQEDTDTAINAAGLQSGAEIGIYVKGELTETLFIHRGQVSSVFGTFTDSANLSSFHNDRLTQLQAIADTAQRKILWGREIHVVVRTQSSIDEAFPFRKNVVPKELVQGTQKYPADSAHPYSAYFPASSDVGASVIAEDLYSRCSGMGETVYAGMFDEQGRQIVRIRWNSVDDCWDLIRADGGKEPYSDSNRLIFYFVNPAYIAIENNTDFPPGP